MNERLTIGCSASVLKHHQLCWDYSDAWNIRSKEITYFNDLRYKAEEKLSYISEFKTFRQRKIKESIEAWK